MFCYHFESGSNVAQTNLEAEVGLELLILTVSPEHWEHSRTPLSRVLSPVSLKEEGSGPNSPTHGERGRKDEVTFNCFCGGLFSCV